MAHNFLLTTTSIMNATDLSAVVTVLTDTNMRDSRSTPREDAILSFSQIAILNFRFVRERVWHVKSLLCEYPGMVCIASLIPFAALPIQLILTVRVPGVSKQVHDGFEETDQQLVQQIVKNDPRIGVEPGVRSRRRF